MLSNWSIFRTLPPTRFGGIGRLPALAVLALSAIAIALLIWVGAGYRAPVGASSGDAGDMSMYVRIVDNIRNGQSYYAAAHAELQAGGYGTRSVFNWRLPTLYWIGGALPSAIWASGLLCALALVAAGAAVMMLNRSAGPAIAFLAIPALALNLVACAAPGAAQFTEVVVGVLILASVAAYGLKQSALGFGLAILALFIRELAAPYVVICVYLAWRERRPAELWAWLVGLAAFAGFFLWHYLSVQAQLGPNDIAYPDGWIQFGGLGFVLSTAAFNGLFIAEPLWATAILLPLCLIALIAWQGRSAQRTTLTVAVYLLLFMDVGKRFNDYWGALYTPLMMLGLPFLLPAVRDLLLGLRDDLPSSRPAQTT